MLKLSKQIGAVIAGVVVMGLFPVLFNNNFYISLMVTVGIWAIVALGLALLMGYTGQVSLGHAAFMGIGAYGAAILSGGTFNLNPWLAIAASALITGLIALVIGLPTLKLTGLYLALATLGIAEITYIFLNESIELTGGPGGFRNIPVLNLGPLTFNNDFSYYYLVWLAVGLSLCLCHNLVSRRFGRALKAIKFNEKVAESMGINVFAVKLQVFVFSAVLASIGGSLYAYYLRFLSPNPFALSASLHVLLVVIVGGMYTIWGAPIGSLAIVVLGELLRRVVPMIFPYVSGEFELFFYGVLLVVIMLVSPRGITPLFEQLRHSKYLFQRRKQLKAAKLA